MHGAKGPADGNILGIKDINQRYEMKEALREYDPRRPKTKNAGQEYINLSLETGFS